MGCGTGRLDVSDRFKISLVFLPKIDPTNAIYTNFKDGVRGLLRERFGSWQAGTSGGKVETVALVVKGPINTETERKQFNRAMNRLLWGVRTICPGDDDGDNPVPSKFRVKVDSVQKNDEAPTAPNWLDEETCNIGMRRRPRREAVRQERSEAKAVAQ